MMSEKSRMRMCVCETRGVKRRRGWCERGERGEERMDGTGGEAAARELRAEPAVQADGQCARAGSDYVVGPKAKRGPSEHPAW